MASTIVLFPNQYVHILNEDDGRVRCEVGPKRIVLRSNERMLGAKHDSIIIGEQEYAIILNPYDEKSGRSIMGEREVVKGPCVLSLNYNEVLEKDENGREVRPVYLLSDNQAVQVQAIREHDDRAAGSMWQIKGPCKYIPGKYEKIVRTLEAIPIIEGQGIYVRNIETSNYTLVKGPCVYMLKVNEELYYKPYSNWEQLALFGKENTPPSYKATVLHLDKGEVACILDYESNSESIIYGPCSRMLGPQEGVKVLSISAGKPKRTNALKIAKVRIGPDFTSDIFQVRTLDNANLMMHVTYKWQFLVNKNNAYKMFALNDFIGYACNSLCSTIREEAAQHNFEEFHNSTVSIIRKALFKDVVIEEDERDNEKSSTGDENKKEIRKVHGAYFPEVNLLISEIDIKDVSPVDENISELLNQSIKSNMIIVCKKMEQEANLSAQKEKVQAEAEIQKLKEALINAENENLRLEQVEKARVLGQALIEKARAQKEASDIKTKSMLQLDMYRMRSIIEQINSPVGERYIELLRYQALSEVPQSWYLSTASTIDLPVTKKFNT